MSTEQRLHQALRSALRQQSSFLTLEGEGKPVPPSFPQIVAGLAALTNLKILQVNDFSDIANAIRWLSTEYFALSPGLKSVIFSQGNCGQLHDLRAGLEALHQLETLNLSQIALGRVGITGILPFLQVRPLRYLNLSGCSLGDDGFIAVCECFQGALSMLQTMVASFNEISSAGIAGMQSCIGESDLCLENLDLAHNNLEDAGLHLLLKMSKAFPRLRTLQVSRCNIKNYGVKLLAAFLSVDDRLRELNLSDNSHCCDWISTVAQPLLCALRLNSSLRVLVLSVPQQHLPVAKSMFCEASQSELAVKYELIKMTYRSKAGFALLNGNKEVLCVIFECLWGTRQPRRCILQPILTHYEPTCHCTH